MLMLGGSPIVTCNLAEHGSCMAGRSPANVCTTWRTSAGLCSPAVRRAASGWRSCARLCPARWPSFLPFVAYIIALQNSHAGHVYIAVDQNAVCGIART